MLAILIDGLPERGQHGPCWHLHRASRPGSARLALHVSCPRPSRKHILLPLASVMFQAPQVARVVWKPLVWWS